MSSLDVTIEFVLACAALGLATLALAFASWVSLEKGRVYAVLFASLAMYGLLTLLALPSLAGEFSTASAMTAAFAFAVGTGVLLGAIGAIERRFPRRGETRLSDWAPRFDRAADAHVKWATIATPLSLVLLVASRESLDISWSEARTDAGILTAAGVFLVFLAVPGAFTAMMKGRRALGSVLLAGCMGAFVISGSRAAVLGGLAYVGWIWLARTSSPGKRARVLASVAGLAFLAHVLLRFIRGFGPLALLQAFQAGDVWELFTSSTAAEDFSGGEGSIGRYLVFAVHVAGQQDFGFMTSVWRVLLLFASRQLLGIEKPLDVTYRLWEAGYDYGLYEGASGFEILQEWYLTGNFGSMHPTLFGELFVTGGWVSLIASAVVFGAVCVLIDRALRRMSDISALLLLGPALVGLLMVARGNSVIGFGYFFYLAAIAVPLNVAIKRLSRSSRTAPTGDGGSPALEPPQPSSDS